MLVVAKPLDLDYDNGRRRETCEGRSGLGAIAEEVEEREALTLREVMARLGCSRATAYRMAHRGDLPGVFRVGTALRVPRESVEDFKRRNALARDGGEG